VRFLLPRTEGSAYAACATTITSHLRTLVELDTVWFGHPTARIVTAAVEAAVGTLRRLRLASTQDTSPALWAAVGTAVYLRSLDLYTVPRNPCKGWEGWEDLVPWNLPHLRRLLLDLDCCWLPEHHQRIFTILGRCSFPSLRELEIRTPGLDMLEDAPAMGRFLSGLPTVVRLGVDGPENISNDIIQHALAGTVTLWRVPDASAVASLSSGIHTLNISTAPHKEDEARVLAFLEALINSRPQDARLECAKLDFYDENGMRLEILPFAQRLHEHSITLLDANDRCYHV
jgi:hypothetical protein